MSKKPKEPIPPCEVCGGSLKRHEHHITFSHVACLKRLAALGGRPGHINEICANHTQHRNLQKLGYHGLIVNADSDGRPGRGYWALTANGLAFVRGELAVPKAVTTFHGVVEARNRKLVFIHEVKARTKTRQEWAATTMSAAEARQ